MGLFGDFLKSITGGTEDKSQVTHPCTNCPSNCQIAPDACSICQPYKEKMVDAIYNVEHKDEIIAQYEVAGTTDGSGTVECPHCGGKSENIYVCDYCGSKLQEGTGKIRVASAADIPNPVLDAQDLIFERYDAVKDIAGDGYGLGEALDNVGSEGLFSSILGAMIGADKNDKKSIGQKMTESEIEEMAQYYGVSVSAYLTGLDNGKYLTLSNKNIYQETEKNYSGSSAQSIAGLGGLAGIAGLAGLTGLGSSGVNSLGSIFGIRNNNSRLFSQSSMNGRPINDRGMEPPHHMEGQRPINVGGQHSQQRPNEHSGVIGGQRPSSNNGLFGNQRPNGNGGAFGGQRPSGRDGGFGGQRPGGNGGAFGGQRPSGRDGGFGGQRPTGNGGILGGQRPAGPSGRQAGPGNGRNGGGMGKTFGGGNPGGPGRR